MSENAGNGLFTILLAAVSAPGVITAAVTLWRWWVDRGDKKGEHALTREQRERKDFEDRLAEMNKRDAEIFIRTRDDADRYRTRLLEIEAERDESYQNADAAWDISRAWKERAHHLKHELENLRSAFNGLCIQSGVPKRSWIDERLPPLDQIVEDNARRFSERGSIFAPPDDSQTL